MDMMKDGLYNKLAQEYHSLNAMKRSLMCARDKACAQLEIVEDITSMSISRKARNHDYTADI